MYQRIYVRLFPTQARRTGKCKALLLTPAVQTTRVVAVRWEPLDSSPRVWAELANQHFGWPAYQDNPWPGQYLTDADMEQHSTQWRLRKLKKTFFKKKKQPRPHARLTDGSSRQLYRTVKLLLGAVKESLYLKGPGECSRRSTGSFWQHRGGKYVFGENSWEDIKPQTRSAMIAVNEGNRYILRSSKIALQLEHPKPEVRHC